LRKSDGDTRKDGNVDLPLGPSINIPAGPVIALVGAVAGVFRVGHVTKRNDKLAMRQYEDLVRMVSRPATT
jgi:hypothetical protein